MATATDTGIAVYADRLTRAQAELASQDLDWLLIGISADFRYLTGHAGHLSERLTLLMLPREGDPAIVVPRLESPTFAAKRDLANFLIWEETEAPTDLVARRIGDAGGTTLAVGDHLYSVFLLRMQAAMSAARWVSANDVMRPLRMRKDAREIATMREVAHRTDDAWHEFVRQPLSGQSETQAMDHLRAITQAHGVEEIWGLCASGPHSASPHHHSGDRIIQPGDAVLFDWGGTLDGYFSDVTRTVHVGEPSAEFRRVYEIVGRANQAALEAVKPGVPCEALDQAARDLIAAEGYGDAFIHRVGHGLGLEVHEEPYLVAGNSLLLAPGMVFSDEPGIYLEGRFGVRIEDTVVCTETGGERLNEATRELLVLS